MAVAELRQLALAAFVICEPVAKLQAVQHLQQADLALDTGWRAPTGTPPGQPVRPELVPPQDVPRRKIATLEGRACTIHAIAHIEFNAINLALDAIWRFDALPAAYYADWLQVAREEANHFHLLQRHLQSLGYDYGDFAAHNALWEMAERTQGDVLARMALVPRTLEARGLDATPLLRQRLQQVGDTAAVTILDLILHEEVGHVAIGNRWFHYLCQQRNLAPLASWLQLATQFRAPRLRPPFNLPARRAAGFSEEELAQLQVDG